MAKTDNVNLTDALKTGENLDVALEGFANKIQDKVLAEAQLHANDAVALSESAGISLSGEERKYFMEAIDSGKGFANIGEVVPPTIINRVFDNLQKDRPLLRAIQFVNVGLSTEWILSNGVNTAFWGKLCVPVQELTDKGFTRLQIGQLKLSAFLPVCKAFLELNSPEWLARYVITVLTESIQKALELAIVDGTGNDQPIGMRRSLANVTSGTHAETTPVEIEKLDVQTAGNIMAAVSRVKINGVDDVGRAVSPQEVLLVVNPQTYYKKIFPMYTIQNAAGEYVSRFPLPFTIVQSEAMPEDEILAGLGRDYFFGLGMGTKLTSSDEYHFVEDERIYLAKMYGNGQPVFDGAFTRYTLKTTAEA